MSSGSIYVNDQLMLIQWITFWHPVPLQQKALPHSKANSAACVRVNTLIRSCVETHLHLHPPTSTRSVSLLQQTEFRECFAGITVPIQKHSIKLPGSEIKHKCPLRILGKLKMLLICCFNSQSWPLFSLKASHPEGPATLSPRLLHHWEWRRIFLEGSV